MHINILEKNILYKKIILILYKYPWKNKVIIISSLVFLSKKIHNPSIQTHPYEIPRNENEAPSKLFFPRKSYADRLTKVHTILKIEMKKAAAIASILLLISLSLQEISHGSSASSLTGGNQVLLQSSKAWMEKLHLQEFKPL